MVTPRTTRCQTLDSVTTQTTAYKGRCLFTPARVRERAGEVRTVAPYSRGIVGPTVYFGPSGTDIGRVGRCHGRLTQSLVLFGHGCVLAGSLSGGTTYSAHYWAFP